MILFPEAKINIGLNVTRRREDGYHILQTLFYPINWCDALEILPMSDVNAANCISTNDNKVHWYQTGIIVDCDPELNLCVKAYRLLQDRFPELPAVEMHLEKQIPFGAGLGGGSSDGAHALLMLREMFGLDVTDNELEAIAARMGADCAFFCRCGNQLNTSNNNHKMQAQYCEGMGYELVPHTLSLKGKYIVVVKPPFGVSTREASFGNSISTTSFTTFTDFISPLFNSSITSETGLFAKVVFVISYCSLKMFLYKFSAFVVSSVTFGVITT